MKIAPKRTLEREVQHHTKNFLKSHGWRIVRQQVAMVTDKTLNTYTVGEKGMADLQAIYYFGQMQPQWSALTMLLWIETKQPGKPLRPDQVTWRDEEEKRGSVVWKVDSVMQFISDYEFCFGWLHTVDWLRGQRVMDFDLVVSDIGSRLEKARLTAHGRGSLTKKVPKRIKK